MENDERQLLDLATEFISLQRSLVAAWREASPSSRDLEMLLDFPKQSHVCVHTDDWSATRHGLGVRFLSTDGLTVDVPFGVDKPFSVDANRLFDFLASRPSHDFGLLPREREPFYALFDRLCDAGRLVRQSDSAGRDLFTLPPGVHRSVGNG
jgi:hypothetical protein